MRRDGTCRWRGPWYDSSCVCGKYKRTRKGWRWLYRTEEGPLPSAYGNEAITFQLQQQALENSNVDTAQTMNEMLSTYRMFEANQKVLQAYDQSLEKAVNEVGRLT
ncbi:flagellar basal body rod C-terminal domain-containing protein [Bacillus sp. JCM 19041]|uniref:flagellar basal body rod C-terminal domain-containing protein n=1 Tax=Bacillus sp. JCM 19041 TaxID=1460637 RepID=UPI00336A5A99